MSTFTTFLKVSSDFSMTGWDSQLCGHVCKFYFFLLTPSQSGNEFELSTLGDSGTPITRNVQSCILATNIQLGRYLSHHFNTNFTIQAATFKQNSHIYGHQSPEDLKNHYVLSEKLKVHNCLMFDIAQF